MELINIKKPINIQILSKIRQLSKAIREINTNAKNTKTFREENHSPTVKLSSIKSNSNKGTE